MNIHTFLDWLKLDCKQTIMNLDESSKTRPLSNPKFEEFSNSFSSHENFVWVLLDYIAELEREFKPQSLTLSKQSKKQDFRDFANYLRQFEFQWDENSIKVMKGEMLAFNAPLVETDQEPDDYLWRQIEPEYQSYFRRLKQK